MNINETSRTYSYPNKIKKIGEDLVLTSRGFFVILTGLDIKRIKDEVIKNGKNIMIQNDSIVIYMKDDHIIIERLSEEGFNRILMVNSQVFRGI